MIAIDKFDLESYLNKFGAKPSGSRRDEMILLCPMCGKEKLCVSLERKSWHCWICEEYQTISWLGKRKALAGAGGLLSLIELLEGCDRARARQIVGVAHGYGLDLGALEEDEGFALPGDHSVLRPAPEIPPPPDWRPIHPPLSGVLTYLQKRGITEDDVRAFGLGWCSGGRFSNRLIFPVWESSRLVYYQGRAMFDPTPEYRNHFIKALNPPNVEGCAGSSEVLMNLDIARQFERVAIVEGPIDCVHTGPSAVCTFGKKISAIQILKLLRAGVRKIDLLWDGPSETEPRGAWPEMVQAGPQLAGLFDDVRLVFLPRGDPGQYSREQIDVFRRSCSRPASSASRLAML